MSGRMFCPMWSGIGRLLMLESVSCLINVVSTSAGVGLFILTDILKDYSVTDVGIKILYNVVKYCSFDT